MVQRDIKYGNEKSFYLVSFGSTKATLRRRLEAFHAIPFTRIQSSPIIRAGVVEVRGFN